MNHYHPLELNAAWQAAANQLKRKCKYVPRADSIVPGVFLCGGTVYHLVSERRDGVTVWVPVTSPIPTHFSAASAAQYTGMSKATFKLVIGHRQLESELIGRRSRIVSDASLLCWLKTHRKRGRSSAGENYRKRAVLTGVSTRLLLSALCAGIGWQEIDFQKLFRVMEATGICTDAQSLLLADIQEFICKAKSLGRADLIDVLVRD